jgi:hypothetical protein
MPEPPKPGPKSSASSTQPQQAGVRQNAASYPPAAPPPVIEPSRALRLGDLMSALCREVSAAAEIAAKGEGDRPPFVLSSVDFELSYAVTDLAPDCVWVAISCGQTRDIAEGRFQKMRFSLLDIEAAAIASELARPADKR